MVEICSADNGSLINYLRSTRNQKEPKVVKFNVQITDHSVEAPKKMTIPPIGIFALAACNTSNPVENVDASIAGEAGKQDVERDTTVAKQDAIAPKLDTVPSGPRYIDRFDTTGFDPYNSFLKGNWSGVNNFKVKSENGALHAAGAGSWPGLNILAAAPGVNISGYNSIQFKIIGNVFDTQSGKPIPQIKVEVYGDNPQKAGSLKAYAFKPITSSAFTTVTLDLGQPQKANTLRQFQILVAGNDVSGWFSIDDVYIK